MIFWHIKGTRVNIYSRQIRNISFSNIRARGYWNALLEGNLDKNISDVQFSNVTLEITDDDRYWEEIKPEERPFWLKTYRHPCGLYAANLSDFRFRNFTLRWREASPLLAFPCRWHLP